MNDQDEDFKLFREQMSDVKPLPASDRIKQKRQIDFRGKKDARKRAEAFLPEQTVDPLTSVEYIDAVKPHDILSFMRPGLQHSAFKKLRLGKFAPEADLDLHGFTVEQSREQLLLFVDACVDEGIRVAVVTHGHGEYREKPALLKSCVYRWLQEIDQVMAFHTAQPRHGGSGATYILLRQSKPEGREE
ncbi:MAG: DNA endonuclease SmrA [Pseudomonadales bacterium]|nr:DNA endonuclease SmrA [Pseudomonadales bacterium]MCP5173242.1 DNA endonuclease SmrA [Pseudomonadales bacterium]